MLTLGLATILILFGLWALLGSGSGEAPQDGERGAAGASTEARPVPERPAPNAGTKAKAASGEEVPGKERPKAAESQAKAREAKLRLSVALPDGAKTKGKVYCGLFQEKGWPWEPAAYDVEPATGDDVSCDFDGLEPGWYAAAAFLDSNGNLELDRNWLGMPKEPWALSQGVRPSVPMPPDFAEVSFEFDGTSNKVLELALRG